MKTVLSIAGTDPSGGAGIQADLKTFAAHDVYGMAVITAIVAQNTKGVISKEVVSPRMISGQIEAVFADIRPDAVKIGMIPDSNSCGAIADALRRHNAANIVIDTVMISSSGFRLLETEAMEALKKELLPLAALVTPNIPETEALCGFAVHTKEDMIKGARMLFELTGASILIKGGHLAGDCDDLLFSGGNLRWFFSPRIATKNTHGTGCTLSSAVAANLALGFSVEKAVARAKEYLTGAISQGLSLGGGSGPLDHGWRSRKKRAATNLGKS